VKEEVPIARGELYPPPPPPAPGAPPPPPPPPPDSTWQAARDAATDLLTKWYVKQDFKALTPFIAADNVFTKVKGQMQVKGGDPWAEFFKSAFVKKSPAIAKLSDAIEYSTQRNGNSSDLHPLNVGGQDPFAVVDPNQAPSFFPNKTATELSPARLI
jgi:hypothetical protein